MPAGQFSWISFSIFDIAPHFAQLRRFFGGKATSDQVTSVFRGVTLYAAWQHTGSMTLLFRPGAIGVSQIFPEHSRGESKGEPLVVAARIYRFVMLQVGPKTLGDTWRHQRKDLWDSCLGGSDIQPGVTSTSAFTKEAFMKHQKRAAARATASAPAEATEEKERLGLATIVTWPRGVVTALRK